MNQGRVRKAEEVQTGGTRERWEEGGRRMFSIRVVYNVAPVMDSKTPHHQLRLRMVKRTSIGGYILDRP